MFEWSEVSRGKFIEDDSKVPENLAIRTEFLPGISLKVQNGFGCDKSKLFTAINGVPKLVLVTLLYLDWREDSLVAANYSGQLKFFVNVNSLWVQMPNLRQVLNKVKQSQCHFSNIYKLAVLRTLN